MTRMPQPHRRLLPAALALLVVTACMEDSKEDPGCCFYLCENGRHSGSSLWYGGAERCEEMARESCRVEDVLPAFAPQSTELARVEWIPARPDEENDFEDVCSAATPAWYSERVETMGCCFYACESGLAGFRTEIEVSEDACEAFASEQCALEGSVAEYSETLDRVGPFTTLNAFCQRNKPEDYLEYMGSVGCCFTLCQSGHRAVTPETSWSSSEADALCAEAAASECSSADGSAALQSDFVSSLAWWDPAGRVCEHYHPAWYDD
jgi:hypothetical protein